MVSIADAIVNDKATIDAAIADAEQKTCGEIVVAFARRAGRYEREQGYVAFGAAVAAYVAVSLTWPGLRLPWAAVALLAGYLLGHFAAEFLPYFPMLLAHQRRRRKMAEDAALVAFHDLHVANTRAHTGILLFVAQSERTVVVLGDGPISEQVTQAEWDGVRDAILAGIGVGETANGLAKGIGLAGDLLARHFPRGADDLNELPNCLYIVG